MPLRRALDAVDHLLLGAPDLDDGIAWLEARAGVTAARGGAHPGRGTRNALAALGGRQYLEIIAPDPAQDVFEFPIDLHALGEPRLVTWAAAAADVDAVAAGARAGGLAVAGPRDGSRRTSAGSMLRWRSVAIAAGLSDGGADPVPFFIQWAEGTPHPSIDAPAGLRLVAMSLRHPNAAALGDALARLGIGAAVEPADAPGLGATLDTPRGLVVL
jgi:glyoxalase-like protein